LQSFKPFKTFKPFQSFKSRTRLHGVLLAAAREHYTEISDLLFRINTTKDDGH
jgi:hypothetical protein